MHSVFVFIGDDEWEVSYEITHRTKYRAATLYDPEEGGEVELGLTNAENTKTKELLSFDDFASRFNINSSVEVIERAAYASENEDIHKIVNIELET